MVAARQRFALGLFAWVVMPEHVHLLVSPGERPLSPALKSLKQSVAQRVIAGWRSDDAAALGAIMAGGAPRFWLDGGGFDRNVRDEEEFSKQVRYIHRNPVERGLVASPELWRWSSVRWWMGRRAGEVECDPPPGAGWER